MGVPYSHRDPNHVEREIVRSVAGLYVGQLDSPELAAFEVGVEEGFAAREYQGVGGLLGLAKVRYIGEHE